MFVRCTDQDRVAIRAKAAAAGLTMADYLVELARRDTVDKNGRPLWAADIDRGNQLELTA